MIRTNHLTYDHETAVATAPARPSGLQDKTTHSVGAGLSDCKRGNRVFPGQPSVSPPACSGRVHIFGRRQTDFPHRHLFGDYRVDDAASLPTSSKNTIRPAATTTKDLRVEMMCPADTRLSGCKHGRRILLALPKVSPPAPGTKIPISRRGRMGFSHQHGFGLYRVRYATPLAARREITVGSAPGNARDPQVEIMRIAGGRLSACKHGRGILLEQPKVSSSALGGKSLISGHGQTGPSHQHGFGVYRLHDTTALAFRREITVGSAPSNATGPQVAITRLAGGRLSGCKHEHRIVPTQPKRSLAAQSCTITTVVNGPRRCLVERGAGVPRTDNAAATVVRSEIDAGAVDACCSGPSGLSDCVISPTFRALGCNRSVKSSHLLATPCHPHKSVRIVCGRRHRCADRRFQDTIMKTIDDQWSTKKVTVEAPPNEILPMPVAFGRCKKSAPALAGHHVWTFPDPVATGPRKSPTPPRPRSPDPYSPSPEEAG